MKKFLFFFLLLGVVPLQAHAQSEAVEAARGYIERYGIQILQDYRELLSLPNVASDIPNIRRNADYLMTAFEQRGVQMELLELPGRPDAPPVVYGELNVPDAERTLIIYVHYDGQPADPENWTHHPWEPVLYSRSMEYGGEPIPFPEAGDTIDPDWRIYARSASDDKAPIPALLATLDALDEADISITSNLKFFFEGEEEVGSPHVREYLETYKEKLDGDIWLFFDGPRHQSGLPRVGFGVRGVTGMEVTVYGPSRSLHSGHYGGWAPVPGQMLVDLLASMKDERGEVLIDGFYDSTAPITDADREALATLPDYDDQIREELGLRWTEFDNQSLAERYMFPTLTIRGLQSGNVGELARNVIPSTATASLGIRLAQGNDSDEMMDLVEAHIRRRGYHIVRDDPDMETRLSYKKIVKVTRETNPYPAVRTQIDEPLAQQIVEAIWLATGEEVILTPTSGGSLPLFHFTEVLDIPIISVPIVNHDNNQHAPDENVRIGNLWSGVEIYSSIFTMDE